MVQQAPASLSGKSCDTDRGERKEQPQQHRVDRHEAQVVAPAQYPGQGPRTPRREHFPQRDDAKDGQEDAQANGRLVIENILFNAHPSLPCSECRPAKRLVALSHQI